MNGTVKKLFEMSSAKIPSDLFSTEVNPRLVQEEIFLLAMRYGTLSEAEDVCPKDIAHCKAEGGTFADGREVLIYTDLNLPGAEDVSRDVLGKRVGETFNTVINGEKTLLTLLRSVRPIPAEVDDNFIASLGIDGVDTVEDYQRYVADRILADKKTENSKEAVYFIINQMVERSEYEYDESAIAEYALENRAVVEEEFREEGYDAPSDEEITEMFLMHEKECWLAQKVCELNGITMSREEAEKEADKMVELMALMGEDVPDREVLMKDILQNFAFMEFHNIVREYASRKLEEAYGNG